MPRRSYKKRLNENDPVYENLEVAKLVNYIMVDGKKTVAQNIVYSIFEKLLEQKQELL